MAMRLRGVHYDVGQRYGAPAGRGAASTRPRIDADAVSADMATIADRLHANAVRIAGTDPDRIALAAAAALGEGLQVWFSPFPCDIEGGDVASYLAEAAGVAEGLRASEGSVVFVAGCELSLFGVGYFPGSTVDQRLAALTGAIPAAELHAHFRALPRRLNAALAESVTAIRGRFHGPVSYASAPWEQVEWTPIDLVGVDLYRDATNAASYRDILRGYHRFGKPLVVTEYGCCTYLGAADAGGAGFMVLAEDPRSGALSVPTAGVRRSEAEQARYAREMVAIFDSEDVHGAFWHTFAGWQMPHRPDPRSDLDVGSFGLVAVTESPSRGRENLALQPKKAFSALAGAHASTGTADQRPRPQRSR